MATILVEIDKRALQGGKQRCNCRPQQKPQQQAQQQPQQQTAQPKSQQPQAANLPAAAVMGAKAAAAPPPQTPATVEDKKAEWSLSYAAWLALLSVGVGIVIISQTKK